MICKGNFNGTLEGSIDEAGAAFESESFDSYCVVICETVEEWGALQEAMLDRLRYLTENNIPGSKYCDYTEEIKIIEKMYNETGVNQ